MGFWLISISPQFFYRLIIDLASKHPNFSNGHRFCVSDPLSFHNFIQLHSYSPAPLDFFLFSKYCTRISVQSIVASLPVLSLCDNEFLICSLGVRTKVTHFGKSPCVLFTTLLAFSILCSDFWYTWWSHILLCGVITVIFSSQFHEYNGSYYLLLFYSILTICLINAKWINERVDIIESCLCRKWS